MAFLDHLDELRHCLIRIIIGVALGTVVGFFFSDWALNFLTEPLANKKLPPGVMSAMAPKPPPPLRLTVGEDGTVRAEDWEEWRAASAGREAEAEVRLILPPSDDAATSPEIALTPRRDSTHLIYLNPITPFTLKLKTAMLLGVLFSLPWILYQIWLFVKPGLRLSERKYASRIVISAMFLFPIGAAFAYWTVPFTLAFFETFQFGGLEAQLEVGKYLGMVLMMMLAMGIVFELPLVILFLVKVGLISTKDLRRHRKQAIVIIFVASAFITPPDAFTMIVMAVPLVLLYEISLLICDLLIPPGKEEGVDPPAS